MPKYDLYKVKVTKATKPDGTIMHSDEGATYEKVGKIRSAVITDGNAATHNAHSHSNSERWYLSEDAAPEATKEEKPKKK